MINRENYEIYFMDYMDGQLSQEHLEHLYAFLEKNPDLKAELEDMSGFKLKPQEEIFPDKASLKQTPDLPEVNIDNIHSYLLNDLEGDLSREDTLKLEEFLSIHPTFKHEKAIWAQTKLRADESVKIDKSELIIFNGEQGFDKACIAYMEGDLSAEDQALIQALIEDNAAAFEVFSSFQQTRLQAPNIVFEDKASLKQRDGMVIPIWWRSAAAIAAVLLIGWLVLPDTTTHDRSGTQRTARTVEKENPETDLAVIEKIDSSRKDQPNPIVEDDFLATDNGIDETQQDVVDQRPAPNPKQTKTVVPAPKNDINHASSDLAQVKIELKAVPEKPELLPIDSILKAPIDLKLNVSEDENNVAVTPITQKAPDALSLKEAVAKSISNRVTDKPSEYDTDINYAALNTVGKITNSEVNYSKKDEAERSVTSFSLGGISFYRSKRKK